MTLQRLRTVARVGARGLLVAGFAGGVWLLSSAAAHASAPAGAMPGAHPAARSSQSVLNPATRPALRLLDQVLAPDSGTTPGRPQTRSAAASVTRGSIPLLASQATPAGRTRRPATYAGPAVLTSVLSTVTDLIGPLRVPAKAITTPVSRLLDPVVTGRSRAVPAAVVSRAGPSGVAGSGTAAAVPVRAQHISTADRLSAGTVHRAGRAIGRSATPGTRQVPDQPERAPIPAYPGSDSTGISTTASGSGHDLGGYAVVNAPAPAGREAGQRLPRAIGAPVRLLLADAPTFAPD